MTSAGSHVVFIHGLWLHATSWGPWTEAFQAAGYTPLAPGWPGEPDTVEEARSHPDQVAGKGIDDVVEHYAQIIRGLDAPPVVIGHSFGGLIAQRLLGDDLAAAAVAIDAAPIKGVIYLPPSALRVASIALRSRRTGTMRWRYHPGGQFRYGFANALPAQEATELYDRWTIPSPGKPLFEAAAANLSAVARQGQYGQQDPRTAPAHRRGSRPYGPGGDHQIDPQAVPQVPSGHRPPGVQ